MIEAIINLQPQQVYTVKYVQMEVEPTPVYTPQVIHGIPSERSLVPLNLMVSWQSNWSRTLLYTTESTLKYIYQHLKHTMMYAPLKSLLPPQGILCINTDV